MTKPQIYKANALVEASYRLSLYEQRIFLACISQVRRDEPLSDKHLYTVSAQQISEMTGTKLGTTYQNLKSASERLFERRVTLHEAPNGQGRIKTKLTRWVQTIEYREEEGLIALRFGTDIVPYLSRLSEQFTRYALDDISKMTSNHAIRVYEMLCQWRGSGTREVSVKWFRETLQLEDCYSNIRDLKRRVIEPAIKQVNEHSPLWASWEQRKTGRSVTHIIFKFGDKEECAVKNKKEVDKNNLRMIYGIPTSILKTKARPGESYEDVALRVLYESNRKE